LQHRIFHKPRRRRSRTSKEQDDLSEFHEARRILFESSLNAYRERYQELSESWGSLETKAQGNAAIAGIFIAGAFGYINGLKRGLHEYEQALLVVSIVFLLLSVAFSLLVLRIRKMPNAPAGENMDRLVGDLLLVNDPKELSERLPRFTNDQIQLWRTVNKGFAAANKSKARNLLIAQSCLAGAISVIATVLILAVLLPR
jgi:hypothetical protein